jgi:hypothetical protein
MNQERPFFEEQMQGGQVIGGLVLGRQHFLIRRNIHTHPLLIQVEAKSI